METGNGDFLIPLGFERSKVANQYIGHRYDFFRGPALVQVVAYPNGVFVISLHTGGHAALLRESAYTKEECIDKAAQYINIKLEDL